MGIEDLFPEAQEIISSKEINEKIKRGEKLRVKLGADPSRSDLHLGHSVILLRLKKLQDKGHKIVFIVGDFTGMIGDPSGKSKTRIALDREQVEENAKSYFEQIGKILDVKNSEIVKNSEWFSKMNFEDILSISAKVTVAQIIERDDFAKRLKAGNDIGLNEMMYPLMQGYDSVMVKSDVEIGGTDQKFNMIMGRNLQKKYGQVSQAVVTMPLLLGLDAVKKMSKSEDNYIALNDSPEEKFGKIMSISDSMVMDYIRLITDFSHIEVNNLEKEFKSDPRSVKEKLAYRIVKMYDGTGSADHAQDYFQRVVVKKEIPEEVEEYESKDGDNLISILTNSNLVHSNSEVLRLVKQGGVAIDGEKVENPYAAVKKGSVIRVGKRRYLKIK